MYGNEVSAITPGAGECVRVDGLEDRRGSHTVVYSLYGKVLATRSHNNILEVLVRTNYMHMGLDWGQNYAWERWIPATQCTVVVPSIELCAEVEAETHVDRTSAGVEVLMRDSRRCCGPG